MSGMAWIRKTYNVPAKRGGRVIYSGNGKETYGTIRSADDQYLEIQLDGESTTGRYHPTWELRYLA